MPQHKTLWCSLLLRIDLGCWSGELLRKVGKHVFHRIPDAERAVSWTPLTHFFVQFVSGEKKILFPYHAEKLWARFVGGSLQSLLHPVSEQLSNMRTCMVIKERTECLAMLKLGGVIFPFTFHLYLWRMKQVLCRNFLTLGVERPAGTSCRSSDSMYEPTSVPARGRFILQ